MLALIVDDSEVIRVVLKNNLKSIGFNIMEADGGRQALETLERLEALEPRQDVNLILVDWNMPEMSGPEFIRAVRTKPLYTKTPIMMVSKENSLDRLEEALAIGANEYLMKPFTRKILQSKLALLGFESSLKPGESDDVDNEQ